MIKCGRTTGTEGERDREKGGNSIYYYKKKKKNQIQKHIGHWIMTEALTSSTSASWLLSSVSSSPSSSSSVF